MLRNNNKQGRDNMKI